MKRETVIIAALGILTLAGCNNNHRSQVRKFKQTAEKTNRSCPTRMNETITLDSTCYNEKDNSVSYFYSVTGELDNATYMNTHYAAFKQALQDAVDNSVEMEEYRKFGTSIRYIYYSGDENLAKERNQGNAFLNVIFRIRPSARRPRGLCRGRLRLSLKF